MKKTYESDRERKIRKIIKNDRLDKHKHNRYNVFSDDSEQREELDLRYYSNSNIEKKRQYF
jgi:hypothetical protein